jgi:hypothetical protein
MAGVPECMRRSRKHLIKSNMADARALELETAKQILAEDEIKIDANSSILR